MNSYPRRAAGRHLDLDFHVLDRQIVDRDGRLVAKVDDLDLETDGSGHLVVTSLLVGSKALGPRFGGRLGTWTTSIGARLSGTPEPQRIDWADVSDIGNHVSVSRTVDELGVTPFEQWIDAKIVARIPGSRHESE